MKYTFKWGGGQASEGGVRPAGGSLQGQEGAGLSPSVYNSRRLKGSMHESKGIIRFSLLENSCCSLRGQNNMGGSVKRVSRGTKQSGSQGATGQPENRGHTGHPFWGRVTRTWGRIRVGCEVEGDVLGGGVLGPWGRRGGACAPDPTVTAAGRTEPGTPPPHLHLYK